MSEEIKKILNMVAEGKLNPEEAERLISALKDIQEKAKFLKVRIFGKDRENPRIKVDIPITALKLFLKLGSTFQGLAPEGFKMNIKGKDFSLDDFTPEMIDKILDEIDKNGRFTLVEVDDAEKNERVEVYIE
ncbi:MAG: hypothetical protein N3A65_06555 [candidate division WOR-3 bacterium]|nr:hypothetical protein [candidate division WOR-3 bacterium]